MNTQPVKTVAVIGGGIIGLASAHFLREAGLEVSVIDQAKIGQACSHGNCGLLSPSHVFPLPGPGALSQGISAFLKPGGPLRIAPKFNLSLWKWLLAFAKNCNETERMKGGLGREPLINWSRRFYEEFINEQQFDCDFEANGCLFVHSSRQSFDHHDEIDHLLRKEFDMGAEKLSAEELEAKEPAIKPGTTVGAWYYPQDAQMRADKLIDAWVGLLKSRGVIFREDLKVTGFQSQQSQASMVRGQGQHGKLEINADAFVVATGAWAPFMNEELGCRIPIQPGKGYSMTMPRPKVCPKYPMILENEKVAVTPMKSGYRLGSLMEFSGYNSKIERNRLQLLKRGAEKHLREPYCEPIEEEWFGWRPMTPNGLPIISKSPRYENVFLAAGHNMIGLMAAPATGKLVAELVTGQETSFPARPYAIKT